MAGLEHVRRVVLVLSGKGGVGKSTVAVQVAAALHLAGRRVGIVDTDLCGPSIPAMLGVGSRPVHHGALGWAPVYAGEGQTLAVMSIGFLLQNREDAVVWRGPRKTAMVQQFLHEVCWGDLDYLVVDTPPGTSDEHLALAEALVGATRDVPVSAILVTTPQNVALADVAREISFCVQAHIPILGLVENMSGFVCPHCTECSNLFSSGGGARLAAQYQIPYLGHIPIDPALCRCAELGQLFLQQNPGSPTRVAIEKIIAPLLDLN